jgi:ligand-binding SRPBCC domain-containing protein
MATYRIQDEIVIDAPLDEVWDFFTNPRNLQRITPESMNFKHEYEPDGEKVYPGMLLVYKVSPIAGIPLEWITEITEVQPKKRFVDDQRKGPFAMWHHIHEFGEGHSLLPDAFWYAGSPRAWIYCKAANSGDFRLSKKSIERNFCIRFGLNSLTIRRH